MILLGTSHPLGRACIRRRLSIPKVVALLEEIQRDARRRYERLFVEHLCDTEES